MRFVIVCGALFLATSATLADCVPRQVVAPVVAVTPLTVTIPHYAVGYSADGDTAAALRELLAEIRSLRQALTAPTQVGPPAAETTESRAVAVLTARCASCHTGPDSKGRDGRHFQIFTAPGQVNPKVDKFKVWDEADVGRMPPVPHKEVSDDEARILKEWVREAIRKGDLATK